MTFWFPTCYKILSLVYAKCTNNQNSYKNTNKHYRRTETNDWTKTDRNAKLCSRVFQQTPTKRPQLFSSVASISMKRKPFLIQLYSSYICATYCTMVVYLHHELFDGMVQLKYGDKIGDRRGSFPFHYILAGTPIKQLSSINQALFSIIQDWWFGIIQIGFSLFGLSKFISTCHIEA